MKVRSRRPGDPFVFERVDGDPRQVQIADLPLSVRTKNRLLMERYWSDPCIAGVTLREGLSRPRVAGDLEQFRPGQLLRLSGFGRISLVEVETWLFANGLRLADGEPYEERFPIETMSRFVVELDRLRVIVEQRLGRKLTLFAESGRLYLIDDVRDRELSDRGNNSLLRARPYVDGGSIVSNLGGTKFSGGGW